MEDAASNQPDRDLALIERAAGGDPVALKLLLTETFPQLCQYVARKIPQDLGRVIDPEDIVQEAEVIIFRQIADFRPAGPNSFYRWGATIALSRLRDVIRAHRAAKRGGGARVLCAANFEESTVALLDLLAGPGNTPSQAVARDEAIHAVESALSELPEPQRQAVRLVHIEGQAVADAASHMQRSDRARHGLCRRGLKTMQQRLQSATKFFSSPG